MGQRTAILLKKNFGNNRSTITLIHHQWGIGKTMPAYLMQEILKASYPLDRSLESFGYGKYMDKLPIDYFYTFEPLNNKENNYITNKEVATNDVNEDIWRSEVRIRYARRTDNNNGLMLVEVTQNYAKEGNPVTYGECLSVKVGFVLGNEETSLYLPQLQEGIKMEADFDRLVSMEEYAIRTYGNPNAVKFTKKFIKAVKTVMELQDVKEVYDKEGAKRIAEKEEHIKKCIEGLTKDLPKGTRIPVPMEFQSTGLLYS